MSEGMDHERTIVGTAPDSVNKPQGFKSKRWPTPAYQKRRVLKAERRAERERRAALYVRPQSRIIRGINLAAQLLAGWLTNAKPQATQIKLKADPFKGAVKIDAHSSLRKLMRAARRNKIPSERLVIIDAAEKNAVNRRVRAALRKAGME